VTLLQLLLFTNRAEAVDNGPDCNIWRALFTRVQSVNGAVGNVRKNLFAEIFKPKEVREFDASFFAAEKSRLLKEMSGPGSKANLLDFDGGRFESKLAYLEVIAQSHGGPTRDLLAAFGQLPPYQRNRLYRSVKKVISPGSGLGKAGIEYRIQDLYADTLGWTYPHLFDGVSDAVRERTLRNVLEARLTSQKVSEGLKEMGWIGPDVAKFQNVFESVLKGQTSSLARDAQINYALAKSLQQIGGPQFWLLLPKVKFHRYVGIPEHFLIEAARTDLKTVWDHSLREYLMKRFDRNLIALDIVYRHLQSAWLDLSYYGLITYYGYQYLQKQAEEKAFDDSLDQAKAPAESERRFELRPEDQNARWVQWKKAHPAAAQDSSSREYQSAHRLYFGK
jgi:hypothetical protein